MPYMEWKPEYSVKVDSIDNEHKKLFAMVNDLHDAMRLGQGSSKAPEVLKAVIDYTQSHFANEEQYMQRAGYADFAIHKAQHVQLTTQVNQMMMDLQDKKLALSLNLLSFMKQWLTKHILLCDMKYVSALDAAGIK
jgi:hemerythrin